MVKHIVRFFLDFELFGDIFFRRNTVIFLYVHLNKKITISISQVLITLGVQKKYGKVLYFVGGPSLLRGGGIHLKQRGTKFAQQSCYLANI